MRIAPKIDIVGIAKLAEIIAIRGNGNIGGTRRPHIIRVGPRVKPGFAIAISSVLTALELK